VADPMQLEYRCERFTNQTGVLEVKLHFHESGYWHTSGRWQSHDGSRYQTVPYLSFQSNKHPGYEGQDALNLNRETLAARCYPMSREEAHEVIASSCLRLGYFADIIQTLNEAIESAPSRSGG